MALLHGRAFFDLGIGQIIRLADHHRLKLQLSIYLQIDSLHDGFCYRRAGHDAAVTFHQRDIAAAQRGSQIAPLLHGDDQMIGLAEFVAHIPDGNIFANWRAGMGDRAQRGACRCKRDDLVRMIVDHDITSGRCS